LLYATLYLAFGGHLPYWPAWLIDQGLSAATMGSVLGAGFLLRLVVAPVSTAFAGRHGDVRPSLRLLLAAGAVGFVVAAVAGRRPGFAAMITIATTLLLIPSVPLLDSVAIDHARTGAVVYGRVRVLGSVAFIVANLVCGALISRAGISLLPWWLAGSVGAAWIVALVLPAAGTAPAEATPGGWLAQIPTVARQPGVFAILAAAGLVQASHGVYYSLGTVHWQTLGYGGDRIGALWGIAVAAEVVLFAAAGRLEGASVPRRLIELGGVLAALRWTCTAFDPSPTLLFPLQLLHAGSFAATHLGAIGFIARWVPPPLVATAQGIYAAMASGLFMGLVVLGAGGAYENFGGHTYLLAAAVALLGAWVVRRTRMGGPGTGDPGPGRTVIGTGEPGTLDRGPGTRDRTSDR
jgi:PPP family 3-phenylpropionic acid transporter